MVGETCGCIVILRVTGEFPEGRHIFERDHVGAVARFRGNGGVKGPEGAIIDSGDHRAGRRSAFRSCRIGDEDFLVSATENKRIGTSHEGVEGSDRVTVLVENLEFLFSLNRARDSRGTRESSVKSGDVDGGSGNQAVTVQYERRARRGRARLIETDGGTR